jgi:hypothetical protein
MIRCKIHTSAMEQTIPEYLSYSQFTTYLQCSEKYRLTRILRVDEDPSWWLAGGTAIHAACDAVDFQLLKEAKGE